MITLREQFEAAFLSANGFHTKAELANEWEKGLSGHMFRAGASAEAMPGAMLNNEQAWTLLAEICGTKIVRIGTHRVTVLSEISDMATAGEVVRSIVRRLTNS